MKAIFSALSILTIVAACNNSSQPGAVSVKDYVVGTYIRESTHEKGHEWDTLAIKKVAGLENSYTIERRWSYERIFNGKKQPVDYKVDQQAASYNEHTKQLTGAGNGVVIAFIPQKDMLLAGTTAYQKLK